MRLFDSFTELSGLSLLGGLKAYYQNIGNNSKRVPAECSFEDNGWYCVDYDGLETLLAYNYEDASERDKQLLLRYFRDDHGEFIQLIEKRTKGFKFGEIANLLDLLDFGGAGGGSGFDVDALLAVSEGSDYISVDLNEAGDKVVYELDETSLDDEPTEDSENLVKSGGVYDAIHSLTADDITADNTQSVQDNLERIDERIDDVVEVAEGKCKAYVIASKSDITGTEDPTTGKFTEVTAITGVDLDELKIGDIIYVETLDTLDYWVSDIGSEITLSKLETTKVDLTTKLDATKQAVANVGGLVVPSVAPTDTALVGVETDREQAQIYFGDGFELSGSTSPYTANVTGVQETRNRDVIKLWSGTQAQYDAISTKDATTLYIVKEN